MYKSIISSIPAFAFLTVYKLSGNDILIATISIIIASIFSLAVSYLLDKKINYISLISTIIVVIFGGFAVISKNPIYIKMKPTIVNIVLATMLMIGILKKNGLVKYLFLDSIKMSEENWLVFSKRFIYYFIILASLNEIIWRNFPENVWVLFKVFGMMCLGITFILLQIPFIMKNKID